MTGEFGLTGYESGGTPEWRPEGNYYSGGRGGPDEKYREIHLKQPGIFYDYYIILLVLSFALVVILRARAAAAFVLYSVIILFLITRHSSD